MECSCTIDNDLGEGEFLEIVSRRVIAKNPVKCGECKRMIEKGEEYLYEEGTPQCEDFLSDEDRDWEYFSTCADCESIREQFFHSFFYGMILHDLEIFLDESGGSTHEECIAALTPRAREIVCGYIEDVWRKIEKEEE